MGFNAAEPGQFNKTIFVKVADFTEPLELRITGEVLSPEEFLKHKAAIKENNGNKATLQ